MGDLRAAFTWNCWMSSPGNSSVKSTGRLLLFAAEDGRPSGDACPEQASRLGGHQSMSLHRPARGEL